MSSNFIITATVSEQAVLNAIDGISITPNQINATIGDITNLVSTTSTITNLDLSNLVLGDLTFPNTDATSGYIMSTNGLGSVSFVRNSTFTNVFTVSQNNPSADFSTIKDAIAHVNSLSPSSTNRFVIQLDSETYNTSSGETFPITVPSYTWLVGAGGSQAMDLGSNLSATMITHSETNTGNSWMIRLSNPGSGLFNLALYYNRASSTGDVYGVIIRTGSDGSEINNCLIYTLNTVSDRCVTIYIDGTSDYLNIVNSKLYARSNVASNVAFVIWNNRTAGAVESIMVKNCIMYAFHSNGNAATGYNGGAHSRAGTTNLGLGIVLEDCYITTYSNTGVSYCITHGSTSASSFIHVKNCHLEARGGGTTRSYSESSSTAGYGSVVELNNVTGNATFSFNGNTSTHSFPIIRGNCAYIYCLVRLTSNQSISASTTTTINNDTDVSDDLSLSDSGVHGIRFKATGLWFMSANCYISRAGSSNSELTLNIPSIGDVAQVRQAAGSLDVINNVNAIYPITTTSSNNYVRAQVFDATGGTAIAAAQYSWLRAVKLS